MREFTIGEHSSLFHGSGFDFVGLRDWQAGDRFESIDWPQSSLTNFSPLIIREFEQPSTSGVIIAADRSPPRAAVGSSQEACRLRPIARALATIGMSAVFFQDSVGLVTFDHDFRSSRGAPANRQGAGHPLPGGLPARARAAGPAADGRSERHAQRFLAQDVDGAGRLGLPLR